MADLATLRSRLAEAEDALHRLVTGQQEVSVSDGTNTATYSRATMADLRSYIAELRGQIARAGGTGGQRRRAIGVRFA